MTFIEQANEKRIDGIARAVCSLLPQGSMTMLDVGCGDGTLAQRVAMQRPGFSFEGVEVVIPEDTCIPMQHYDGTTLPFPDKSFDGVLCVDMLHHTEMPIAILREACRVAKQYVVVKDHICDGLIDRSILTCMDWLGNVGTGVPLPFRFLSSQQWHDVFAALPYKETGRLEPLQYWGWPMRMIVDRQFHFVSLLENPGAGHLAD